MNDALFAFEAVVYERSGEYFPECPCGWESFGHYLKSTARLAAKLHNVIAHRAGGESDG